MGTSLFEYHEPKIINNSKATTAFFFNTKETFDHVQWLLLLLFSFLLQMIEKKTM